MLNKSNTNIERIIAQIDNDFNPDNSDWIPRVGAWCISAMSMLNVIPKETKVIKVPVNDRIVILNESITDTNFKVYDAKGCEIKKADEVQSKCNCSSTGEFTELNQTDVTNTTGVVYNEQAADNSNIVVAETINSKDYPPRYNVVGYSSYKHKQDRNYVIIDSNKIELNYDTDYVCVKQKVVKTEVSSVYNCELPIIPNNGLLIEAIAYFCMYKMLCRGYKHPVFNLNASQYGTNPYYMWIKLKDEAKRSVLIDSQGDVVEDGGIWQSAFYINTFNPRK